MSFRVWNTALMKHYGWQQVFLASSCQIMNCGHHKTTMNFQFYKTSLSIMETRVLVQKSKFKMTTMEANQHIWHPLHRTMVTADHWSMVNCRETANRLGIQRTPWSNIITRNINQSKRIGCKPQLSISQLALNGELSLPIKSHNFNDC